MTNQPTLLVEQASALNDAREAIEYRELCDTAKMDGVPQPLINLMLNRDNNLVVEFEALSELFGLGFELAEIAKATGKSQARIQSVLRTAYLRATGTGIYTAIQKGEISNGVARRLIKLSPKEMDYSVSLFKESGKLKMDDLDGLRKVTRTEASASLPADLFRTDPHEEAKRMARQYVERFPNLDADELVSNVVLAMDPMMREAVSAPVREMEMA